MSCNYHPFVGTPPGPIILTPPDLIYRDHVTFVSDGDTIDLRNPEFQDTRTYSYTRINRTTVTGAQELFTDPIWPKNVSFNLVFSALSEEKAAEFREFLHTHAGELTTLTDFWTLEWLGVITTPDAEFTTIGQCNVGVTINFKGEFQE